MPAIDDGLESVTQFRLISRRMASNAGHDPRSAYVEKFWLPALGPSTTWLLRHLSWKLEHGGERSVIDVAETARSLGLGERPGRHAPFLRAIRRAADFDMLIVTVEAGTADGTIALRRRMTNLPDRLVARLPPGLQAEHRSLRGGEFSKADDDEHRAKRLARTLLDLGESESATEAQLIAWRIDPVLAREGVAAVR